MAADGCSMEPIREQRLAEARREIKVPLRNHLDRSLPRFLEGCPANHAMLSPAHFGGPAPKGGFAGTFHALSLANEAPLEATATPAQEFCDFFPRSPDCICLGTSVACLSHGIPRRPPGGR